MSNNKITGRKDTDRQIRGETTITDEKGGEKTKNVLNGYHIEVCVCVCERCTSI